jgi:hypothetical protein
MAWFTGEEISTCKTNGETKASAWQLPSANSSGRLEMAYKIGMLVL